MGFLGVPTILNSYMLVVPSEADFDCAVKKLKDANFLHTPWSFASLDPKALAESSEITKRVNQKFIPKYKMLDDHSTRFHFPTSNFYPEKVRTAPVQLRGNAPYRSMRYPCSNSLATRTYTTLTRLSY
ncbi:hypothetical protein Egran_06325 [Elaphomyces granulatus]|uniref:Uncharacterized protein n=1 Tax=Elaphomyces granulatus TaxID=519963 RepID=A0A232LQ20_9EURO|nr:hypothetical protein Egran_06325 [Elaphomyces granulatus]